MEYPRRRLRTVATDRRVWGVTLVLGGLPALGILTGADVLLEPAAAIAYGYLLVLCGTVGGFPSSPSFWAGFLVFCFAVAAVLVAAFDRVRAGADAVRARVREATE